MNIAEIFEPMRLQLLVLPPYVLSLARLATRYWIILVGSILVCFFLHGKADADEADVDVVDVVLDVDVTEDVDFSVVDDEVGDNVFCSCS